MRNKKNTISGMVAVAICFLACFFSHNIVLADNDVEGGGDSGIGVGGGNSLTIDECLGQSTCTHTSIGATWREYTINDPTQNVVIPKEDGIDGDTINIAGLNGKKGCAEWGATKYYRLALERINLRTNSSEKQVALWPVGRVDGQQGSGGSSRRPHASFLMPGTTLRLNGNRVTILDDYGGDANIQNWDTMYENYQYAKNNGYVEYDWEDTTWFCWNEKLKEEDLGNNKTKFYAQSSVRIDSAYMSNLDLEASTYEDHHVEGNTHVYTSDYDGQTIARIETKDPSIEVNFRHKMYYQNDLPMSSIEGDDTATANWNLYRTYSLGTPSSSDMIKKIPSEKDFTVNVKEALVSKQVFDRKVSVDDLEPGQEKIVCSYISYKPKYVFFKEVSEGVYAMSEPPEGEDPGSGATKACVIVKRTEDEEIEPGSGMAEFTSESIISIAGTDLTAGVSVNSGIDGFKSQYANVEEQTTTINLSHIMHYANSMPDIKSKDQFPNVSTDWHAILTVNDIEVNSYGTYGTYEVGGSGGGNDTTKNTYDSTYSLTLAENETKTVCIKNFYKPKYYNFKVAENGDIDGTDRYGNPDHINNHQYYIYESAGGSGSAYSKSCITVTRIAPEGGYDGYGASVAKLMYTGETSNDIGWDASMQTNPEHRVEKYMAGLYLVPADLAYDGEAIGGGVYIDQNSADYWSHISYASKGKGAQRDDLFEFTFSPGDEDYWTFHFTKTIENAIPNLVGYKLCNVSGFYITVWYLHTYPCGDEENPDTCEEWVEETEKRHWHVMDSACGAIAKKPSLSIWNGGLMVKGEINTSLAYRFIEDDLFNLRKYGESTHRTPEISVPEHDDFKEAQGHERRTYGSWAEDLAVIGGKVNGLGSGSILSRGIKKADIENNQDAISPLTIANDNPSEIGNSNIDTNNVFVDRVIQYLDNPPNIAPVDPCKAAPNGKVRIIKVSELSSCLNGIVGAPSGTGSYNSIYEIPQTIIFSNGDLRIYGDITEINAWIIANGEIDTCANFKENGAPEKVSTAAIKVNGQKYTEPDTTVCDEQLVFNGPVIAKNVKLNRTFGADPEAYGSDSERYTSAEVFNLSGSTYLWAYAQASRYKSSYSTGYSRELPPRY